MSRVSVTVTVSTTVLLLLTVALCNTGRVTASPLSSSYHWPADPTPRLVVNRSEGVVVFPKFGQLGSRLLDELTEPAGEFHFQLLSVHDDSVQIGAKNVLFTVQLSDLTEVGSRRVVWRPDQKTVQGCVWRGNSEERCQNYIRLAHWFSDTGHHSGSTGLVCGTYGGKTKCANFTATDSGYVEESFTKETTHLSPPFPEFSSAFTSVGDTLFTATNPDFRAQGGSIASENPTVGGKLFHLRDPVFVKTMEIGDFVYFFFRARDATDTKYATSRVARVCKRDTGYRSQWSSLVEAQLLCRVAGADSQKPFDFDELQSVYQVRTSAYNSAATAKQQQQQQQRRWQQQQQQQEEEEMGAGRGAEEPVVYAVFTTPANSIPGSAVCAYRVADIDRALDSLTLAVTDSLTARYGDCHNSASAELLATLEANTALRQRQPLPVIASVTTPTPSTSTTSASPHSPAAAAPLLLRTTSGDRLTHVAVLPVQLPVGNYLGQERHRGMVDMVYVTTESGRVLKAVVGGVTDGSGSDSGSRPMFSLVHDMPLSSSLSASSSSSSAAYSTSSRQPGPVVALTITGVTSESQRHQYHQQQLVAPKLLVVRRNQLQQLPLAVCAAAGSCHECVALRDPYCAWQEGVGCVETTPAATSSGATGPAANLLQNVVTGYHPACARLTPTSPDVHVNNRVPKYLDQPQATDLPGQYISRATVDNYDIAQPVLMKEAVLSPLVSLAITALVCLLIGLAVGWLLARRHQAAAAAAASAHHSLAPAADTKSHSCSWWCWRLYCCGGSSSSCCCGDDGWSSTDTRHLELQAQRRKTQTACQPMVGRLDECPIKSDNRYEVGVGRAAIVTACPKTVNMLSQTVRDSCGGGGGGGAITGTGSCCDEEKNINCANSCDRFGTQKVRKMYL